MNKETSTELMDTIKERLSSPVFGTFIISFLVCNWKIPIGLFLSKEQLPKEGYTSYFNLVSDNLNIKIPIWFTLFYVFAYPFIKNIVIQWGSFCSDFITDLRLRNRIYKKQVYSATEYQKLEKEKQEFIQQLGTLREDRDENKTKLKEKVQEINEINSSVNINFYNGTWKAANFMNFKDEIRFSIQQDIICQIMTDDTKREIGKVIQRSYDNIEKRYFLLIQNSEASNQYFYYSFKKFGENSFQGRDIFLANKNSQDINFNRL